MTDLSTFQITKRWPPKDADAIQLYSFPTPNGVKVSIMLEELGLPYDAHTVSFANGDQFTPEFLSLNPNNKIPAIIDPDGPDGKPMPLFESGAILIYLAEKTGKLMPKGAAGRYEVLQWLMFQIGGLGPMFGQLGYFTHFDGKDIEDPRPAKRYIDESARLLEVLDGQLEGRDWVCGEYSIADIAIAPWIRTLRDFYKAGDLVDWDDLDNVPAYLDRFLERPAVQAGLKQPPRS
ncbi:MAG: glutathione S-transferase N-terminal domain-containing protein [Marinosulfonomonas sp.]|nr:glutathione S-transferase N-terminal domain-containing protein [Marinosulfonomonas sp.]